MPQGEQFLPYFPGLIPVEADLWRIWLKYHESEFDAFEYNVRVGQGLNVTPVTKGLTPELSAALTTMWQQLTQKKIDVVGQTGVQTWIFEVEERPGTRALGQLLTYATWLTKQRELTLSPTLAIVCRALGPDMLEVFQENGIVIYQLQNLTSTVREIAPEG